MSELGRVLRLDARRAALLVVVPALALLGVAPALRTLGPGNVYWDNASVALAASVRMLGPVTTAFAGWSAIRERRLDYLRDLTARSPATGPFLDVLRLSGAAFSAYAIVALVIVAEAGQVHALSALAGAAGLILHVVIGYLAGRRGPVTAVAVSIATALWAWLRQPGPSWWTLIPPAVIGPVEPFTGLRTEVLADQALWSAGLAVALLLALLWSVTRAKERRLLLLPLAVAVAVTGIGTEHLRTTGGATVPVAVALTCRQWPLTVCVHPALRSALPALEAAMTPLASRLTGTRGAFTRVEQRPAVEPAGILNGVALVHLPDLSPGYEARVLREIRDTLGGVRACTSGNAGAGYGAVVDAWLLGESLDGAGTGTGSNAAADPEAAQIFASWDEQSRRGWLRSNFESYQTCGLTLYDFR